MKRLISAILSATLLFTCIPTASATSDIEGHWAESYITYLSDNDIMKASASDGTYSPDQEVTRAEFMRYINRAFGFTQTTEIDFDDVSETDANGNTYWYYEPIQIAVAHGYINGVGNNNMDPLGYVTREQAATIIGRLHKIEPTATTADLTFTDYSLVQDWSAPYIADATEKEYISGYPDGTFAPQDTITRAELAKILYFYTGTILNDSNETYDSDDIYDDRNNVSITVGCNLEDTTVYGDLYITEGVAGDSVTLTDVNVIGDVIISGGMINMENVSAANVIVSTPLDTTVEINAYGNTNIGTVEIQDDTRLYEFDLDVSAGGFSDIIISGDENPYVTIDGDIWSVYAKTEATITTLSSTYIYDLTADAAINVEGTGSVKSAILNADGSYFAMQPSAISLGSGVTANIAGEETSSSHTVIISPNSFEFDVYDTDSIAYYNDFTTSYPADEITTLYLDDYMLVANTDYRVSDDGVRIYNTFFKTIDEGSHMLTLNFLDGSTGVVYILATDTSKNYLDISAATFNKYDQSLDYSNISISTHFASGVTLQSVKMSGSTLALGTAYTYNAVSGTIILQRSYFEEKSVGTYTLTFTTTAGNSPTLTLYIEDSTPVNAISPTTADFDSNSSSGGYVDLVFNLECANGAELSSITANGQTLQLDWNYKLSGDEITISKSALADLASSASYIDIYFKMTDGETPRARVYYVTTYSATITVKDDLGGVVSGAQVSIIPSDSSEGSSAAQTLYTDDNGQALFYVKSGTYTITAMDDKFETTITKSTTIKSTYTLSLAATIIESVDVYVTSSTGARLSDATVSMNGQKVVTGSDGVATFSIKRGTYSASISHSTYGTTTQTIVVDGSTTQRVILYS